jgi:orotidine-5'-phosphate decarboxylase
MDFQNKLISCVGQNNSLLCVGLDPDQSKIPSHISGPDAVFEFIRAIVDSTADLVCAFKPNSAFYEADGASGIEQLKKICDYIISAYPHIPIILDAKRADIGNTNLGYATYAFEYLKVDAITLNPYLGSESLSSFLERADKGMIILCRTSNPGAGEFQDLALDGKKLYQIVAEKVKNEWNKNNNCLLVVGASYPEELAEIRRMMGDDITFLVPGLGAQGGEVEETIKAGVNKNGEGIIVNSSRNVLYASDGIDFANAAKKVATEFRDEMNKIRSQL